MAAKSASDRHGSETLEQESLSPLTVEQLRERLAEKGLPTTGKKKVLLERSVQRNDEKVNGMPEIDIGPLPDPRQLQWFKKYRMDEAKTMSVFRSLTFFIAFLVVMVVVCYGNRDYHQYLMVQETRTILPKVALVHDALGLWHWIINTFATGVYVGNWYNANEEANKVYINDDIYFSGHAKNKAAENSTRVVSQSSGGTLQHN